MNFSCFKLNCGRVTTFACQCTEIPIYSCKKHLAEHQITDGYHNPERLLMSLNRDNRNSLNEMAVNVEKYINEAIQSIQKSSASVIEAVIQDTKIIIDKLISHQKMIASLIKEAKKYKEVNRKNFETLEYLDSVKTFAEIKYENIKPNYIDYYDLINFEKSPNVIDSELAKL